MARKKRRTVTRYVRSSRPRGKKQFTIPLAVVAGFTPAAMTLWNNKQNATALGVEAGRIFLGWDYWAARWDWQFMKWGTIPIIAGVLVHKVANRLGINRLIASTGIPVIRL